MDVVPVERRDEDPVQAGYGFVCDLVTCALDLLDPRAQRGNVTRSMRQLEEELASFDGLLGVGLEVFEEAELSRQDVHRRSS